MSKEHCECKDLIKYVEDNYPDFYNQINLRFELGHPYKNGSKKRINQVVYRATAIFEELFKQNDYIHMYMECFDEPDVMFGNTTPEYLYELLSNQKINETIIITQKEDVDDNDNIINVDITHKIKTLYASVESIPYKKILEGIGNYEQGREPSIGHRIYFIDMDKGILFNMYDDRGCIIYSHKTEDILKPLYDKYNDWLSDYWRKDFDVIFNK